METSPYFSFSATCHKFARTGTKTMRVTSFAILLIAAIASRAHAATMASATATYYVRGFFGGTDTQTGTSSASASVSYFNPSDFGSRAQANAAMSVGYGALEGNVFANGGDAQARASAAYTDTLTITGTSGQGILQYYFQNLNVFL